MVAFFFCPYLLSQKRTFTGSVRDSHGFLPGIIVSVKVKPDDKSAISYTITDASGKFVLTDDTGNGEILEASSMFYETRVLKINQTDSDYSFVVDEKVFDLKEVEISSAKIIEQNDTTKYLTRSFTQPQDRNIGDVIQRMPGFEVSETGRIKYNGKDISQLYIDKSDLMGQSYGVAVKSINHVDVASVEVIEGDQPVKLLRDVIPSFDTSVNINLKEKARNRITGSVLAGGGIPSLWTVNALMMRFAKQFKTLNSLKTNNTGDDVSLLTKGFILEDESTESVPEYISQRITHVPFLDKRHTLLNKSYLFSSSNQLDLTKDIKLSPKLDVGYARIKNESREEKEFLLSNEGSHVVTTQNDGLHKNFNLSPSLILNANTNKIYLRNNMEGNWEIKQSDNIVTGNFPNRENTDLPEYHIKNELDLMFRFGRKIYSLKSVNSYFKNTQKLNIDGRNSLIYEKINTSRFYSSTQLSQTFGLGLFSLSIDEGIMGYVQSLSSQLSGLKELNESDDIKNSLNYKMFELFLKPSLSYKSGSLRASIGFPFYVDRYDYYDKIANEGFKKTEFRMNPSFNLMWTISDRYTFQANSGYEQQQQDPSMFFRAPILTSYPFITDGLTRFYNRNKTFIQGSVRYKDILKSLFYSLSFAKSWNNSDVMPYQNFNEKLISNGYIHKNFSSQSDFLYGNFSYLFDFVKGGITLKGGMGHSNTFYVQNDNLTESHSSVKEVSSLIYVTPIEWMNIEYGCTIAQTQLKIDGDSRINKSENFRQNLSVMLHTSGKTGLSLNTNHYYFDKHVLLADLSAFYKYSSDVTLECHLKNIFNQRRLNYTSNSETMIFRSRYKLRPFSFWFTVATVL